MTNFEIAKSDQARQLADLIEKLSTNGRDLSLYFVDLKEEIETDVDSFTFWVANRKILCKL